MIRDEGMYQGTVRGGSWITSRQKGTPGFQVSLETDDGDVIDFTIWITEKSRESAVSNFEALGVTPEQLSSRAYLTQQLPVAVAGRPVSFEVKEETYKNQTSLKVKWLGGVRGASQDEVASSVADFFGGRKASPGRDFERQAAQAAESFPVPDEDDIPF